MKEFSITNEDIENIKKGSIVLLPTDTIYGLSCCARNKASLEKIYELKGRDPNKSVIVLVSSIEQIRKLNIEISTDLKEMLEDIWPEKVTVLIDVVASELEHISRGKKEIGFRVPKNKALVELLEKVGPLVSTSANPQGLPPAKTIAEAKKYFGDNIDIYIDAGELASLPSSIVRARGGRLEIVRKGDFEVPEKYLAN